MNPVFTTEYTGILQQINGIDPVRYAKTRNFINGSVTYLSPYLSRGVISLSQVKNSILSKFTVYQSEKLLQELAWREYYQRVWQEKGNDIFTDLKNTQPGYTNVNIPSAVINASTGIHGIDEAIQTLYQTGYMHNHARMYTSMLTCNIARSHWLLPAEWMYYHLLDGDLASNMLSWQWVCGAFSSKQYYANQENINKYTGSIQQDSFLDHGYDTIAQQRFPTVLSNTIELSLSTKLPEKKLPELDPALPLLLYNSYQLDPEWHKQEKANRVLVLEPSHFSLYPVSGKVIRFIIELALKNIPGIQIFCGEISELGNLNAFPSVYHKEHPLTQHYPGFKEPREWMFPEVIGYFPGFFGFWKKCEKYLR